MSQGNTLYCGVVSTVLMLAWVDPESYLSIVEQVADETRTCSASPRTFGQPLPRAAHPSRPQLLCEGKAEVGAYTIDASKKISAFVGDARWYDAQPSIQDVNDVTSKVIQLADWVLLGTLRNMETGSSIENRSRILPWNQGSTLSHTTNWLKKMYLAPFAHAVRSQRTEVSHEGSSERGKLVVCRCTNASPICSTARLNLN